jgi:cysteine desulfuration protein SufE
MKQQEFVDLFNSFENWQDKFDYLILLGDELQTMPQHLRIPENLIKGCQSRTYFCTTFTNDVLHIYGCSNASIPAGLVAVMHHLFNGCTKDDLSVIDFHIKTDLVKQLSPRRADGLVQMIERIFC